jgi:aryl-alcohol dehydrogenase-like predicted oxidoreductase
MVFTKGGQASDDSNSMSELRRTLKPESIRKECDASLRRLGMERIDPYQFHWPDETGTPVEDSWEKMARLVEQGKVRMAEDDWRRRNPEFLEPKLSHNVALRDALRPIAQRHDVTVSALAVAWVNARPGVTATIVGARSAHQVGGWIGASSLELTAADLEEIANAIERTHARAGWARSPQRQAQPRNMSRVA